MGISIVKTLTKAFVSNGFSICPRMILQNAEMREFTYAIHAAIFIPNSFCHKITR